MSAGTRTRRRQAAGPGDRLSGGRGPESSSSTGTSPLKVARIAGALYLAFILASVLASLVGHIGLSDAGSLYRTITTGGPMFRLGFVSALASGLIYLLAAWTLYILLRPVDRQLALLFLLLNALGVAVQSASMLPLIQVLLQGDSASHLQAFSPAQLAGLGYLSIGVYKLGFVTAQLFFSAWLVPLGYLIYRSALLPRSLGVLLILDGFADLVWFLQGVLLPAYPAISYPAWALSFIAEAGLALWLLIKGVKVGGPP
ncbi:MAG: DUF4386 domain-containing protein [Amnibacterium sp.]